MCESKVFLLEKGQERKLMDNVIHIEPHDGKLFIYDLLGEQMIVDAAIKEIKLLEHKIILEGKEVK